MFPVLGQVINLILLILVVNRVVRIARNRAFSAPAFFVSGIYRFSTVAVLGSIASLGLLAVRQFIPGAGTLGLFVMLTGPMLMWAFLIAEFLAFKSSRTKAPQQLKAASKTK
jgi:hypothetical protein